MSDPPPSLSKGAGECSAAPEKENATSWNVKKRFEKPPEGSDDVKNVQDDVIVNVERCTKERLEDANMNSRGLLSPRLFMTAQ